VGQQVPPGDLVLPFAPKGGGTVAAPGFSGISVLHEQEPRRHRGAPWSSTPGRRWSSRARRVIVAAPSESAVAGELDEGLARPMQGGAGTIR